MLQLNLNPKSFILHLSLFLGIYLAPSFFPVPFIVISAVFFYLKNKNVEVLLTGLYSVACKSEIVFYCYILTLAILFFIDNRKITYNTQTLFIRNIILIFLLYLFIIYCLQLFDNNTGSILSLPFFAITFLSAFVIPFYIWKIRISQRQINIFFNQFLLIAICQFIIALFLQAIPMGLDNFLFKVYSGDSVKGSTNSTYYITLLLMSSITPFVFNIFSKNNYSIKDKALIWTLFLLFILLGILNDSKTSLALYLILIFSPLVLRNKKIFFIIGIAILLIISAYNKQIVNSLQHNKFWYEYIWGDYSYKVQYYQKCLDINTRPVYQYVLGTGGGTNGSRAANALAYDQLSKTSNSVTLPRFIPPHTNEFTSKNLAPIYTSDIVDFMQYRSAILGNPFNSFCAFFVEFGIIGFLIFSFLFFTIVKPLKQKIDAMSKLLLISFTFIFLMSLLTQYLENGAALFLLFTLIGFAYSNRKICFKS